jgi:hypothetical protein
VKKMGSKKGASAKHADSKREKGLQHPAPKLPPLAASKQVAGSAPSAQKAVSSPKTMPVTPVKKKTAASKKKARGKKASRVQSPESRDRRPEAGSRRAEGVERRASSVEGRGPRLLRSRGLISDLGSRRRSKPEGRRSRAARVESRGPGRSPESRVECEEGVERTESSAALATRHSQLPTRYCCLEATRHPLHQQSSSPPKSPVCLLRSSPSCIALRAGSRSYRPSGCLRQAARPAPAGTCSGFRFQVSLRPPRLLSCHQFPTSRFQSEHEKSH